ncbi:MAG: repeat domain protein [Myxococcaceae bacterium]|nr:repeat domain protein [Myxococcaceae bacterium]
MKTRYWLRLVPSLAPLAVAALVTAGAAPGCYGATEIDVTVTTTVACTGTTALTTQVFTGPTGTKDFGTAPAAETVACGDVEPRVGTLSIVPSGARDDQFDIEVVGAVGVPTSACRDASLGGDGGSAGTTTTSPTTGCIVARRRVSFRPHKSQGFTVRLDAQCIGVPCGVDQTCDVGICTPTADCTDLGCPRERNDVAVEAGVDAQPDAPIDAPIDAHADAGSRCGPSAEVVIDGQSIVGPLAMQGTDFLYVDAVPTAGTGSPTVTEIRRVPRAGATVAKVVQAAQPTSSPQYAVVAASSTDVGFAAVTGAPSTSLAVVGTGAFGGGSFAEPAIALAGTTMVGFWRPQASNTWRAFSMFGAFPSVVNGPTSGTATLPGRVAEVLVDELGDFYGVGMPNALVHYKFDPAGKAPVEVGKLVTFTSVVGDIALAPPDIYFAGNAPPGNNNAIYKVNRGAIKDTFNDAPFLSVAALPKSMTSDGTSLYFIIDHTLSRVDFVASGAGMTVTSSIGANSDRVEVDDQCVYWVENGTTIMKRAKR